MSSLRHTPKGTRERAKELLAYFLAHPESSYAMQQLARSCLPEQLIYTIVTEVDAALRWLVERGFLVEHRREAAETLFSLNEQQSSAAKGFLDEELGSNDESSL